MGDIDKVLGHLRIAGEGAKGPSESWSVDKESNTIQLDNGYSITFDNKDQSWHIKDATGKETQIWGDPHVVEGDGGKWDFKAQMTFELEDGTKITVKTKPIGDGSVTVSDELTITKGDQCIKVTGIADNNVQISDVTMDGQAVDAAVSDGYLARMGDNVEDWEFGGKEITHNLPFVDYETYTAGIAMFTTPPWYAQIDPNNIGASDPGSGKSDSEIVSDLLDQLQGDLETKLADYQQKLADADNYYEKKFYQDLVNATQGDLTEIKDKKDAGSLADQVKLYNRVSLEFQLEVKYNINLTSKDAEWSIQDLTDLDNELKNVPPEFSMFDDRLSEIRRQPLDPGVGGVNYGGLITIAEGQIKHAIVHEIGHDFDNENPRWDDFLAASGWENRSSDFSNISSDMVNGAYVPLGGSATYKDGTVYHDGDKIDLDGDGQTDGVVQVHYGKVYVCDENAKFVTSYASTNPLDDFAECFKYFFDNPQALKNASPEKYAFMVEYMGWDPLNP